MKIYKGLSVFLLFITIAASAQEKWSFKQCLDYAYEHNLQILASRLNEQAQRYNYKIARNQLLPDVNASLNTGFTFEPQLMINTGDYQYTKFYQNSGTLSASLILFNMGNLNLNKQKNLLLLQQNQFLTEKAANDISLQITADYLNILLSKELLNINFKAMDINRKLVEKNEKLYKAGSIPLGTVYESRANLATAKQDYENMKIEVNRARLNLAILLQKDYDKFDVQDVRIPDNIQMPLINLDNIINYAFENQPEIKAAELGAKAAKKDIKITRTAKSPAVTMNYQVGTSYANIMNLPVNNEKMPKQWQDNHSQSLMLGIDIPIFNKGIYSLKVQQAKISEKLQNNNLEQSKLILKQTIQAAYFDVSSSYQSFLAAKAASESTGLSFDYAQKSFDAGKIAIYDLNIARNNYFAAQSQMVQAKYNFLFKLRILEFYGGKPLKIGEF